MRPPPFFTPLQRVSVSSLQASYSMGSARMSIAACVLIGLSHSLVSCSNCGCPSQLPSALKVTPEYAAGDCPGRPAHLQHDLEQLLLAGLRDLRLHVT